MDIKKKKMADTNATEGITIESHRLLNLEMNSGNELYLTLKSCHIILAFWKFGRIHRTHNDCTNGTKG